MMNAVLLSEGARLPAFHSGGDDGDMVDRAAADRHISTDVFKATPPKNLACAGNMLDTHKAVVVGFSCPLAERRPDQSKFRMSRELPQQKRKVVGIERDVRIEADNHVVTHCGYPLEPCIERSHLGGKVAPRARGQMNQLNPRILPGIARHDVISAVGRAVAYDHPSEWQNSLRQH